MGELHFFRQLLNSDIRLPSSFGLLPLTGHATNEGFDCFGYRLPAEALQRSVA
jgi:hypothetical protein